MRCPYIEAAGCVLPQDAPPLGPGGGHGGPHAVGAHLSAGCCQVGLYAARQAPSPSFRSVLHITGSFKMAKSKNHTGAVAASCVCAWYTTTACLRRPGFAAVHVMADGGTLNALQRTTSPRRPIGKCPGSCARPTDAHDGFNASPYIQMHATLLPAAVGSGSRQHGAATQRSRRTRNSAAGARAHGIQSAAIFGAFRGSRPPQGSWFGHAPACAGALPEQSVACLLMCLIWGVGHPVPCRNGIKRPQKHKYHSTKG